MENQDNRRNSINLESTEETVSLEELRDDFEESQKAELVSHAAGFLEDRE